MEKRVLLGKRCSYRDFSVQGKIKALSLQAMAAHVCPAAGAECAVYF